MSEFKETIKESEKELLIKFLSKNLFNLRQTAKEIGCDPGTVKNKINSFGIDLNKLKLEAAAKLMAE